MLQGPDSIDEMLERPEKFHMPTFEEFQKRGREHYFGRKDDMTSAIDKGDPLLGCRQKYFIMSESGHRYEVSCLEVAERIALDMGGDLHQNFIPDPQLRPDGAGGFYNEVTFISKSFKQRRAGW